ncbi:MAG: hypothetical protein KDJ28_17875 [Candidatus Competibacteraceae bacterium]|nr:hypothetical protein [Candidatus Competibacteraceae bacterium]
MKMLKPPTPLGSRRRRGLWLRLAANGFGQALSAIFATVLISYSSPIQVVEY